MTNKKIFSFLFWYNDSPEYGENKSYIATSINTACRKFHNWRENTNTSRKFERLDYEVKCEEKFIDISEINCTKKYIR